MQRTSTVSVSASGWTGLEAEVDEREVGVRPVVVLPRRGAAAHVPESRGLSLLEAVAVRVEGLVRRDLVAPLGDARDALDRVDLGDVLPPHVGDDSVLGLQVRQTDRLGDLPEEVRDGRAVEPERLRGDVPLEREVAVEVEEDLEDVLEVVPGRLLEPLHVEEEELLRKGEVLREEAVAHERPVGVGEEPLVPLEADARDDRLRQLHRRGDVARAAGPELDGDEVVVDQLVEGVDDLPLALEEEAERFEGLLLRLGDLLLQLAERGGAECLQLEPQDRPDPFLGPHARDRQLEARLAHLEGQRWTG